MSVDYSEGNINGTDEYRDIDIALDSGAVDHVICTDLLPLPKLPKSQARELARTSLQPMANQ